MKNEYPQFDGVFEVQHHTEVLAELIADGRLEVSHELAERVTYHDSCFLGRHNSIYEPPRDVLRAAGAEVAEIEGHCRERGFCCGAGGAHMWVEENEPREGEESVRINHARCRQAQQAAERSGSRTVAANCPFCIQMFDDGIPSVEADEAKRMKTYDVAELLEQAVFGTNGAKAAAKAEPAAVEGGE
jgi:Fe-S oxidoreductase